MLKFGNLLLAAAAVLVCSPAALAGKTRKEDLMVVLKSNKDTPYQHWIRVTGLIEQAGGIVALQLEETREEMVK